MLYVSVNDLFFESQFTDYFQVCVTCIKADDRDLKNIKFPLIFLDEASMAMEPASLVPIVKGVGFIH